MLKHYRGVCHAFVDESADIDAALRVVVSAKVQRPSACNALEGLLVHRNIAPEFLPGAAEALHREQVRLLGCERSQTLSPHIEAAAEADWGREFLDLVMTLCYAHFRHFWCSASWDWVLCVLRSQSPWLQDL